MPGAHQERRDLGRDRDRERPSPRTLHGQRMEELRAAAAERHVGEVEQTQPLAAGADEEPVARPEQVERPLGEVDEHEGVLSDDRPRRRRPPAR